MKLSWVIEGSGAGARTVRDADHAAQVLATVLRAAYSRHSPDEVAQVLYSVLGPLRVSLTTEGQAAVTQGCEWSAQSGGLLVRLLP